MTASEQENHKIFLEDARQTYYSRQSHFANLSTKASVNLALIIGFITFVSSWLSNGVLIHFKLAALVLVTYAAYLSIRVMFVKKMKFMSIDAGLSNLANHPNMETVEWTKLLIRQYAGFIKELQQEYDTRNQQLRQANYILGIAVIIYLVSIVIK